MKAPRRRGAEGRPWRRAAALLLLAMALLVLLWWMGDPAGSPGSGGPSSPAAIPVPPGAEGAVPAPRPRLQDAPYGGRAPRSLRGTFRGRVERASDHAPLALEGVLVATPLILDPVTVRTRPDGTFTLTDFPYPTPVALLLTCDEEGLRHGESRMLVDETEEILLSVEQRVLVRGRVVGMDGVPAPGVTVEVGAFENEARPLLAEPPATREARREWSRAQVRVPVESASARTDGAGRFEAFLERVPVLVEVATRGVPGYQESSVTARRVTDRFFEAEVRIPLSWSVTGMVVGADGRPMAGVRVSAGSQRLYAPGEAILPRTPGTGGSRSHSFETGETVDYLQRWVLTDAEGRFAVTPVLPADSIVLSIDTCVDGRLPQATPRVIPMDAAEIRALGSRVDLGTVALKRPEIPLSVRFLRPDGTPETGLQVVFRRADLHYSHNLNTADLVPDGEGRVASEFLEAGSEYIAILRCRDYASLRNHSMTFVAGEEATLTVERLER